MVPLSLSNNCLIISCPAGSEVNTWLPTSVAQVWTLESTSEMDWDLQVREVGFLWELGFSPQ